MHKLPGLQKSRFPTNSSLSSANKSTTPIRWITRYIQSKSILEIGRRFFNLFHSRQRPKDIMIPLLISCDLPILAIPELSRPIAHRRQSRVCMYTPYGFAFTRSSSRSGWSIRRGSTVAVSCVRRDRHGGSCSSHRARDASPQRPTSHAHSLTHKLQPNSPPPPRNSPLSQLEFRSAGHAHHSPHNNSNNRLVDGSCNSSRIRARQRLFGVGDVLPLFSRGAPPPGASQGGEHTGRCFILGWT